MLGGTVQMPEYSAGLGKENVFDELARAVYWSAAA